ncbi:hypothetical protein JL722_4552 [Aureococcus anophagefferens]|nr:hypothetical protein JL722_4552 [Aureococcus anophagefferens]
MSGEHGQPLGLPAPVRRSLLAVLVVAVAVASDACDASVGDAAALAAAVKRAGSDACVGRTSTVAVTADIALAAPVHVWANASVSLVGPRAISGAGDHGLFVTRGRLALSGLRLADGAAASGAASSSGPGARSPRHDRDARGGGGALALMMSEATIVASASTRSGRGGALYVEDESNCSVSRSLFRATSAASSGGAVALVGGGSLAVEDTVFEGAAAKRSGGAVLMSGGAAAAVGATFDRCVAAVGGAVHLEAQLATSTSGRARIASDLDLRRCAFSSCRATAGDGGGVSLGDGGSTARVGDDTSFVNCSASKDGGGVASAGRATLAGPRYVRTAVDLTTARVSFEDNAAILGASFYSETGLTASLRDRTTFSHTTGSFLTSLYVWMGNTMDLDATSGVRCAVGTTIASQFVVPAPFNFTPFVFWSNGELCPDVKENAIGSLYPPFLVQTVSVGCEPCPRDSYTLGAGSWLGTERRDPACLPCPYGATCEAGGSGVVAKPGYKGEVSGSEGEIGAPVVAFERCAEHREGPLCGSCAPGSSAALFTDACRDDGACGTAAELAQVSVLVLAAAAAYALFLYYLPCSYASEMSLCVYFWQNCFLVLQTGGSLDRLSADAADVARAVGDVARVRLSLGGSRGYCLYAGATTVAMIGLNFVMPVAVLLATLLLHTVARAGGRRAARRDGALDEALLGGGGAAAAPRLATALVNLGFLLLSTFFSTMTALLGCVGVKGLEGARLFVQADIACYRPWQAPLFVVAVLVGGAFAAPLAALCLGRGAAVDRGLESAFGRAWTFSRDVMAEPFERRHAASATVRVLFMLSVAVAAALAHAHAMPFKRADTNYLQGALLTALPVFCALQLPWSVTSTINAPVGRDDKLPVIANRCAKCSLAILALPCAWAAAMVYQQRHVWDDVATRAGRASKWLRRRVRARAAADASEIRIN